MKVHRFNKPTGRLLPHIGDGTITFIGGATTEIPSFELNSALAGERGLASAEIVDR